MHVGACRSEGQSFFRNGAMRAAAEANAARGAKAIGVATREFEVAAAWAARDKAAATTKERKASGGCVV